MVEEPRHEIQSENEGPTEVDEDDMLVRGTRLLSEIYGRCNFAEAKPVDFEEAMKSHVWVATMKEEMMMIEKNETWLLVDRLGHMR